jgi:heptosyltransferase-3
VPSRAPIRRVLIHRLGSLGDTLVALPSFHLLARVFPDAERRLLTNFPNHAKAPAAAAVLGNSGLIHGYLRYTVHTRNPLELLRLAWEIRRFRPDVVIDLTHRRPWKLVSRDRFFFRLAGVRRAVGFSSEEGLRDRLDPATGLFEAEAARLGRAIGSLGRLNLEARSNWDLRLTPSERTAASAAMEPVRGARLIVCGPGTKMQAKDWGRENWRSLLARLNVEYPQHGLAIVGSKEDYAVGEFVAEGWRNPKVNLCGRLSPRETAAAIEPAEVFLGPDSGPMHLAASVGVPCVVAFSMRGKLGAWFPAGDRHEIVYRQTSCSGCGQETCVAEGRRCLTSIAVDEMAEAVARVLSKGARDSNGAALQAAAV